jgi:hypothetical protein
MKLRILLDASSGGGVRDRQRDRHYGPVLARGEQHGIVVFSEGRKRWLHGDRPGLAILTCPGSEQVVAGRG